MDAEEYPDDVRRILDKYVDPESVTNAETKADLDDWDFANSQEVADALPTRDDVEIDRDTAHSDGVTTREEVEQKVAEADEVGVDERRDALTDAVAREVGAPTEQELQRAQIEAVNDTVTPGDVIEGDDRTSQISVVRDTSGDVVATVGGAGSTGRDVADELGADHYGSIEDFADGMSVEPAPDGRRGLLRDRDGDAVGEVEL